MKKFLLRIMFTVSLMSGLGSQAVAMELNKRSVEEYPGLGRIVEFYEQGHPSTPTHDPVIASFQVVNSVKVDPLSGDLLADLKRLIKKCELLKVDLRNCTFETFESSLVERNKALAEVNQLYVSYGKVGGLGRVLVDLYNGRKIRVDQIVDLKKVLSQLKENVSLKRYAQLFETLEEQCSEALFRLAANEVRAGVCMVCNHPTFQAVSVACVACLFAYVFPNCPGVYPGQ